MATPQVTLGCTVSWAESDPSVTGFTIYLTYGSTQFGTTTLAPQTVAGSITSVLGSAIGITTPGFWTIQIDAFNSVGHSQKSPSTPYQFIVNAPTPPVPTTGPGATPPENITVTEA